MAEPEAALEAAIMARMPRPSGVEYVHKVKLGWTAKKLKNGRKGPPDRTLMANCACAGCGADHQQIVIQHSLKMPTLEAMEARLLAKVEERFAAHAACHAAAVQRAYDEVGSDDVAMQDSGESYEDADAHGQNWAVQPGSKRPRRDLASSGRSAQRIRARRPKR
jgi:hypothetical protein